MVITRVVPYAVVLNAPGATVHDFYNKQDMRVLDLNALCPNCIADIMKRVKETPEEDRERYNKHRSAAK